MKNTGIEYEKLTKKIFEQIINQDVVKTINVQHDVVIKGKTTSHQIDVYWEFDLGGITYRTVIQAKDWHSKVPQKEMYAFRGILDDLPVGTKGIYVSKSGYQAGAIDVAKQNDINIYILREPTDKDWDGKIKTVIIDLEIRQPIYNNISAEFDFDYLKNNLVDECELSGRKHFNAQSKLLDENKKCVGMLIDVLKSMTDTAKDSVIHQKYTFENDTFLEIDNDIYAKIVSLSGDIGYKVTHEKITIDGENTIGYILKDLLSEQTFTFDKNENLIIKK